MITDYPIVKFRKRNVRDGARWDIYDTEDNTFLGSIENCALTMEHALKLPALENITQFLQSLSTQEQTYLLSKTDIELSSMLLKKYGWTCRQHDRSNGPSYFALHNENGINISKLNYHSESEAWASCVPNIIQDPAWMARLINDPDADSGVWFAILRTIDPETVL